MSVNTSKRTFNDFADANGSGSSLSTALPSSKRPRAEPNPAVWDQIRKLPPQTTQNVLYEICMANPSATAFVHSAHTARLAEEANKPPVNFDYYSKSCWQTLNFKYERLSCSAQYYMMGYVFPELSHSVDDIMKQAGPDTRWQTRRNALVRIIRVARSLESGISIHKYLLIE